VIAASFEDCASASPEHSFASKDTLFDLGLLDELDLARLYRITGQYFDALTHRFQLVGRSENKEPFAAEAFCGFVPGLATIMEGIIIRGGSGQLWAAFIDDDVVRYFTTQRKYEGRLPTTIEEWLQRFKGRKVVFDSEVEVIPPEF